MDSLMTIITRLSKILGINIYIITSRNVYSSCNADGFDISIDEIMNNEFSNYKGFNILPVKGCNKPTYLLLEGSTYVHDKIVDIILAILEEEMYKLSSPKQELLNLIENKTDDIDLTVMEKRFKQLKGGEFIVLAESNGKPFENFKDISEIIENSMENIMFIIEYKGMIIILSKDKEILKTCNDVVNNILADLYFECRLAIGGRINCLQEIPLLFRRALEAFSLQKKYHLKSNVLVYENMHLHRIISNIDEDIKSKIVHAIFNQEFVEILDSELKITIDAIFKNNLNITDAAREIYIHRNTLLYRLEKIYKYTGFDLRVFEDSLVFRLAWLMKSEK